MKTLLFFSELAEPTLKTRTADSITIQFIKIPDGAVQLSYSVSVSGIGSDHAQSACVGTECTVSTLSSGRMYDITVKACITGISPPVCSDASNAAKIQTLPNGKLFQGVYTSINNWITSNTIVCFASTRQSGRKITNDGVHPGNNHGFK